MKRVLLAIAGVFLVFAQPWRQDADRLFRERRYADAARVLEAGVRSHPEDFVLNLVLESGLQHPDVNAAQRVCPVERRSRTFAGASSA